ncbi:MAG TPA: rhomboid family intramembrane serine protease [Oculatellaceae cyanobacterium]
MFPLKDSVTITTLPVITWIIVILNVLCFGAELLLPSEKLNDFITAFGVIPLSFVSHFGLVQLGKVVSSLFVHAGVLHIAGNMWFLWIFGDGVEDKLGSGKYLLLYLGSGILASIVQITVDPHSQLPMVGASGAISGVLGAYFYLFPRATVSTFLLAGFFTRVVEIPESVYLGFWFMIQLISGFSSLVGVSEQGAPPVAFWAHAAGFIVGLLCAKTMVEKEHGEISLS